MAMKLDTCFLCGSSEAEVIHHGVRDTSDIDVLKCGGCGLVRLSETIENADVFYQESGMRGGRTSPLNELRRETWDDDERRFRFTEKMIEGKSVLDFGCGDGGYLLRAKTIARDVCGVELESSVREALQKEGIPCYEAIREAGTMDVITMFHVLEHIDDPVPLLREIAGHLSAGGQLIVEVPNADDALLSLYGCDAFADFTYWKCHIYLYTMDTLRRLAKKANLWIRFMKQIQRYPLCNHMYWLAKGKPGGHFAWSFLDDKELSEKYGSQLAKLGIADTILCGLSQ